MSIRRVVPDINSTRFDESREFYTGVLGFGVGMDLGWVVTFVSPSNPTAQLTIVRGDPSAQPQVTIEVGDVDAVHATAVAKGAEIAYPLTDEPWGVRRFWLRDPNGVVLNIMCHRSTT